MEQESYIHPFHLAAVTNKKGRKAVDEPKKTLKLHIAQSVIVVFSVMAIIGTVFCAGTFAETSEEHRITKTLADYGTPVNTNAPVNVEALKYSLIAAAIAFGLGALGAGYAISHVGAAAMGAVAEKPQVAGQALIFVALAEGIVIFGFITALIILGKA
jgi:V/A-type H+-transporting ATPase subunit K